MRYTICIFISCVDSCILLLLLYRLVHQLVKKFGISPSLTTNLPKAHVSIVPTSRSKRMWILGNRSSSLMKSASPWHNTAIAKMTWSYCNKVSKTLHCSACHWHHVLWHSERLWKGGTSGLCREGRQNLAEEYDKLLGTKIKPWIDAKFVPGTLVRQQDGVNAHTSKTAQEYLRQLGWAKECRPSSYTDLSPLDYSTWD